MTAAPSAAFGQEPAAAATARAANETELVINKGTFARSGQRFPATLRNIVDALTERFRRATITIVGVDDLLIDNVTLRWGKRVIIGNESVEPTLHGVLAALNAASGHRFSVESFGPNDFLLSAPQGPPKSAYVEIFNLTPLLSNNRRTHLEGQLRDTETDFVAMRKVLGPDHPDVVNIKTRIEILKAHVAQIQPPIDARKVVEKIETAVELALGLLKSADKPQFSYHPGTNLLIVGGGDEANEVTRKVVTALVSPPRRPLPILHRHLRPPPAA